MVGPDQGRIVNITDRRSAAARDASLDLSRHDPQKVVEELVRIGGDRHLRLPARHELRPSDVFLRRLRGVLALARESDGRDFESLLLTEGLGPRTMQALALVAEVACGAPSRFDDPARFAFAHGGKDGHPTRSRSASTTARSRSCATRSTAPGSATATRSTPFAAWTAARADWRKRPDRHSSRSSTENGLSRPNEAE